MYRYPRAEWRGPSANEGPAMVESRGLVVHIAEGTYEGTIAWQKNPEADVSSHFVVAGRQDVSRGAEDGQLAQVVDLAIEAWTQRAGNGHWHSIECSEFTPHALSAAQCETIAQLYAWGMAEFGWPPTLAGNPDGRGLGYHSMGTPSGGWTGPTWGHEDCPGPNIINQLPGILNRAIEINGGGDMPRFVKDTRTGAVWISGGPWRTHLANPKQLDEALKAWGATAKDIRAISTDDQLAGYGRDTGTATGGAGEVADHEHTGGTTGGVKR